VVDGSTQFLCEPTLDGAVQRFTCDGLTYGLHNVVVTEGPQGYWGAANPPVMSGGISSGTFCNTILVGANAGGSMVGRVRPSWRVVFAGNSISNGFWGAVPSLDGHVYQVRVAKADGAVTNVGWGNEQQHDWLGIEDALAALIATACDGTTKNTVVWCMGTNDAANGNGGAFAATQLRALQSAQFNGVPGLQHLLFSPIPRAGIDMTVVRAANIANASTVGGEFLDGSAVPLSEWSDYNPAENPNYVHPVKTGHTKIFTYERTFIGV